MAMPTPTPPAGSGISPRAGDTPSEKVLVKLLPFETVLTLCGDDREDLPDLDFYNKTIVLQSYMTDFFKSALETEQAEDGTIYAPFDRVKLDWKKEWRTLRRLDGSYGDGFLRHQPPWGRLLRLGRQLDDDEKECSTVRSAFSAVSIFVRDGSLPFPSVTRNQEIQLASFKPRDLLPALQGSKNLLFEEPDEVNITEANAAIILEPVDTKDDTPTVQSNDDGGMDTVIIVAIVVAAMATFLLGTALVLAWRRKKRSEAAFKIGGPKPGSGSLSAARSRSIKDRVLGRNATDPSSPSSGAGSPGPGDGDYMEEDSSLGDGIVGHTPETRRMGNKGGADGGTPGEISTDGPGGVYPESVISDDITSSLNAYGHQVRMNGAGGESKKNGSERGDNASVSSMESYGYSLDGYASSVAPSTQYGY